eukprot:354988-Chlamydomonas_euryale.AAC.22
MRNNGHHLEVGHMEWCTDAAPQQGACDECAQMCNNDNERFVQYCGMTAKKTGHMPASAPPACAVELPAVFHPAPLDLTVNYVPSNQAKCLQRSVEDCMR